MMKRIGLWAFAGLGVAVCWAFIAAAIGPHYNLNRSLALAITMPLSSIGRIRAIPITYYESILLNSITYALFGLAMEPLWRLRHHAHSEKVARL
jgi:hypothetical protein